MSNPRLIAVVTAFMMIAGTTGANAAVTLSQLREVERLILGKDCGALWGFLMENSELLEGGDPLAVELRSFVSGVEGGLIECLSIGPNHLQTPGSNEVPTPIY